MDMCDSVNGVLTMASLCCCCFFPADSGHHLFAVDSGPWYFWSWSGVDLLTGNGCFWLHASPWAQARWCVSCCHRGKQGKYHTDWCVLGPVCGDGMLEYWKWYVCMELKCREVSILGDGLEVLASLHLVDPELCMLMTHKLRKATEAMICICTSK